MDGELFKYLLEQSSGVIIAVILILRMEKRIDVMSDTLAKLMNELVARVSSNGQNTKP